MEFPDGILMSYGSLLQGLRTGPDPGRIRAGDRFDPNRVGLDHLVFGVGSRAEIKEDPDNIQVELTAPHG